MQQTNHILVIVAHPDDIEIGMGGTMAQWTAEGNQVTYCIVTDGAAGSNDPTMNIAELPALRQKEQNAAAEMVGVTDVRYLGYHDGSLEPTMALRRDLTRIIRELRPFRVVLMDPTTILLEDEGFNYINHPDHRAAGEAALYAVFPSAESRPIFPELLAEGLEPHHVVELWMTISTKPNTYVDITEVLERKVAAVLCHRSQLDERFVPFLKKWSEEDGKHIGVAHAESFRVMRFPVEDAVAGDTVGEAAT